MWECSRWDQFNNNVDIKSHIRFHFPFKKPLSAKSIVRNIRTETMFGYAQCDLSVPDELEAKFSNFLPIFKNIDVSRNDIGEYMKTYVEENDLLTTATNVDIELQVNQRNTYHTTFKLLLGSWTTVYKNSLICTIHTA